MKKSFSIYICLALLTGWNLPGFAQQRPSPPQSQQQPQQQPVPPPPQQQQQLPSSAKVNQQELSFLKKAVGANVWDVQTGKMAQRMAKNEEVKKFGLRTMNDHSEALQKLLAIAKMKGFTLSPNEMDPRHQKLMENLQKAGDFDTVYMNETVDDHKFVINELENDKPKIVDPDFRAWIDSALSVLRHHLAVAEEVRKKVEAQKIK